ncbi:unnamed protein product [Calypogeia fissa]
MCPTNAAKQYSHLGVERNASKTADPEEAFLLENKGEVMKSNYLGAHKTGCRLMDVQGFCDAHEERASTTTKLTRALAICLVFMVLEIVGGYIASSLAVLADAAHVLTDVAGFAISLVALRAIGWLATPKQTFGYFRLEVLGALVSVQITWVMTGIILYEAFQRLYLGVQVVDGHLMFYIACIGLVMNVFMIFILGHTHDHQGDASHWHRHGHCHSLHEEQKQNQEYDHLDDLEDGQSQGLKSGCCKGNRKHRPRRHLHHHGHEKSSHNVEVELSQHGTAGHRDKDNIEQKVGLTEKQSNVRVVSEEESDLGGACETISLSGLNRQQAFEDEIQRGSKSSKELNINLRGAYLHALGDLIQNIGLLITGVVVWVRPEWKFIDLLCSVISSVIVLTATMRMLRDIWWVLMESAPKDIDMEMLNNGLLQISGISAVIDLHVWALTPGINLLSCHVKIKPGVVARKVLHDATEYCYNLHTIKHVTIQIEEAS